MIGAAEASAIEAIGKAEAERMRQKAAAYKQYGDAAMMSLILESLPKVSLPGFFYSGILLLGNTLPKLGRLSDICQLAIVKTQTSHLQTTWQSSKLALTGNSRGCSVLTV